MKQGDYVIFDESGPRTGQFQADTGLGVSVYGYADGRLRFLPRDAVRLETPAERHNREHLGIYAEDRA